MRPSLYLFVRDEIRGEFAAFPENHDTPDFNVTGDIGSSWDY